MSAIDDLSELFPGMQLIATTHSPIVMMGVEPWEVVHLKLQEHQVVADIIPDFRGYSYEDVLTRLFFTPARRGLLDEQAGRWKELSEIPDSDRTRRQKNELTALSNWMITSRAPPESDDQMLAEIRRLGRRLGVDDS